ncbi:MAG TPA: FecR domain-containing protein [Myxococcales bacterium]|jgi:hypothetical protein
MACAEKSALWGYAAGELDAESKVKMEAHLAGCEACRAELEAVKATREVLSFAAPLAPKVDWRRADEKVHGAVEAHFLRAQRGWNFWAIGLVGAGAFAMVFAVLTVNSNRGSQSVETAPVAIAAPVVDPSPVETAEGALVALAGEEHVAKAGEDLKTGSQVKTTASGKAVFKLPEGSRVRVASASDLLLSKAAKDEVGLVLKGGRVAVTATHAARKAFLVEAGGATVRVIGTAFTVGLNEGSIEVAVAEGRVVVEMEDGQVTPVSAGERLSMDRSKPIELKDLKPLPLTASDRSELNELGVQVALAEATKPLRPASPRPAVAAPVPTPAPVPVATPAKPAEPEPVAAASPRPTEPRPSLLHPPRKPAELESKTQFETLVDMFEDATNKGHCTERLEKFVFFLEEPEEEMVQVAVRAKATCLVARCYQGLDEGVLADKYYRKCLELQPGGPFSQEARQHLPK